jgi:hypothetical protein
LVLRVGIVAPAKLSVVPAHSELVPVDVRGVWLGHVAGPQVVAGAVPGVVRLHLEHSRLDEEVVAHRERRLMSGPQGAHIADVVEQVELEADVGPRSTVRATLLALSRIPKQKEKISVHNFFISNVRLLMRPI